MEVVVAVKQVTDYRVKVRVAQDNKSVVTENLKKSLNPFDAIAVEAAVQLKEQGLVSKVTVVTIGSTEKTQLLLQCLAMGACEACHIETEFELKSSLQVAKVLAAYVGQVKPKLVMLGKQAIDSDASQTGPMLAGLLSWPQLTFVSKLNITGNSCEALREIDQGLHTVAAEMPAVVTVDLRLNSPRFPSLPNIVAAKRKPLTKLNVADLCTVDAAKTTVISYAEPSKTRSCEILDGPAALVTVLRDKQGLL